MDAFEHLFRRETGRIIATLTRILGVGNLALAEDVVQDALCRAVETWRIRGVPADPRAWLLTAAKNRALDILQRETTARTYAPHVRWQIESEQAERTIRQAIDEISTAATITDDMLRMMFSCCSPRLPVESQIAVVLRIMCGFSVAEIARAFLSSEETIKKRITRAKSLLADSKRLFDLTEVDFAERLSSVQRALYLMFNEGFHGSSTESAIRTELCEEAMRLTGLLCENASTATPATHALMALMCLNAARLPSRIDSAGELTALLEQDRSLWDQRLMAEGQRFLEQSATGEQLTGYHLEAAIASFHAGAPDPASIPWSTIVTIYDQLMRVRPSPVVALNRALAVAQCDGAARGLDEIAKITDRDRLASYPFYSAALGELERRCGRTPAAIEHYRDALALARNPMERQFLERRIADCQAETTSKPAHRK